MQVCTSLQTDNHASTRPLSFLQAIRPSCHPTNSVKALKAVFNESASSVNSAVVLSAFAAEHRAAVPLLLCAGTCHCQLIRPACTALSSKPAACRCYSQIMGQTDGPAHAQLLHRPRSAYYAVSVNSLKQ